jgi:endoglucanase
MKLQALLGLLLASATCVAIAQDSSSLRLHERGYLSRPGLDVLVFSDIYPDGHQTGVTIIQHGTRVAANGDVRLEKSPGQWSPIPKAGARNVDQDSATISQYLSYPDPEKDRRGFNPIFYPDLQLGYWVRVTPERGGAFRIRVDLDQPLPKQWAGRVGFNLELFPTDLFGKSWLMDAVGGIFPRQPGGPLASDPTYEAAASIPQQANSPTATADSGLTAPFATGKRLTIAAESDLQRMTIESVTGSLELIDGRSNHNNGWFIVRGVLADGATTRALEWVITPHVVESWRYEPVIQVSQVGYAPAQPKRAIVELDARDETLQPARLHRLTERGAQEALSATPTRWGNFLRYRYEVVDFSSVREPGMYVLSYGGKTSHPFRIGDDVYARHVWQPTLEYFLPVQMCHMRVSEKYRIWHGLDHQDDALMAPVDLNHFDGYVQGPTTLTKFQPGEPVPGLAAGGWHDAGDYDLRVESQMGTVWLLAKMIEEFGLDYDATTIDQASKQVEIRDADGKNDALQQIEHGLLSVLGGYRALGRLYRGIIEPDLRAYVLLGDAAVQTDNAVSKPVAGLGVDNNGRPIVADDRWVFTEDNPERELQVAAGLLAAGRVLQTYNPALAEEATTVAKELVARASDRNQGAARVFALAELIQSTNDARYVKQLVAMESFIVAQPKDSAWMLASILDRLPKRFVSRVTAAVAEYQKSVSARASTDSPYGVPYEPNIWGAGWDIQKRGVQQYFFHKGWPKLTSVDSYINALNFILGVHPGSNTASFVSGVGSHSVTTAYGVNRADWSYIPGGVVSGTNLVRPDLPELKEWPYFWQQTEYVMGGGETNFMFLALAADKLYRDEKQRMQSP